MSQISLPYIHSTHRTAIKIGNEIIIGEPLFRWEVIDYYDLFDGEVREVDLTFFAFTFDFLPISHNYSRFPGKTEEEIWSETLKNFVNIIIKLHSWSNTAYSLRFQSDGKNNYISISLIVRLFSTKGMGHKSGAALASSIHNLFASAGYPIISARSKIELDQLLRPFNTNELFFARINQKEIILHTEPWLIPNTNIYSTEAYVVYSYKPRKSTWVQLFDWLITQKDPWVISVYLEPTFLYPFEQRTFSQVAQFAESISKRDISGLTYEYNLSDPVARLVAKIYYSYLHKFTTYHPYLLNIQIGSPNPITTGNIAQSFASEITDNQAPNLVSLNDSLPSGFDIVFPKNDDELKVARHNFSSLSLSPWGAQIATIGKERLPYLVDPNTACAAFRFPIPTKAGIPGVKTKYIVPNYDIGPRSSKADRGEIELGVFSDRGGVAVIPILNINRHILIAGSTGSGKTTTAMQLLIQLWENGIPFLVIEPEKKEYRTLYTSPIGEKLLVFTLGEESISPFRLNPFEIIPGISVERHISYLKTCFEASLPGFGILSSLIEESLLQVYFTKGWNLTEKGQFPSPHDAPTLGQFYFEIIRTAERRGYSEKTLQDIRAAASGRIVSFLRGSKGRMLNTRKSISFEELMTRPTILELGYLNDDEKSMLMMFLLTFLREYCAVNRQGDKIKHVTLIEEAHRVMERTQENVNKEISSDVRYQAVKMFSDMLSEIRSAGEGIVIAEQIPGRLAEDALKNTATKIIHRLPGEDDLRAVASTMNLDPEQENFLSTISVGKAAFSNDGFERATFIDVHDSRKKYQIADFLEDEQVKINMSFFLKDNDLSPFRGCSYCKEKKRCPYRDRISMVAYDVKSMHEFQNIIFEYEEVRQSDGNAQIDWNQIIVICNNAIRRVGLQGNGNAAFCYFVHMWEHTITNQIYKEFWNAWKSFKDN